LHIRCKDIGKKQKNSMGRVENENGHACPFMPVVIQYTISNPQWGHTGTVVLAVDQKLPY
jgi:hypothetical protein